MAPPHSTTSLPLIMSIPQANVNSPLRGVNSTVTGSLSGSLRSILYSLITTSFAQVASVFRTKVTLAGAPALSLRLGGSKPLSVTSTVAVCVSFCSVASAAAPDAAPGCLIDTQQLCAAPQHFAAAQQFCALALQQFCAAPNAAADSAMAATSSVMDAIIVFLYIVFLLIDFRFMIELLNFTRVAAAFSIPHTTANRHREHLRYGRKPDVEDGNHQHPRRVCPLPRDVNRCPFDNQGDRQPGCQHHEIAPPPRIYKPITSAERRPAGAKDEKNEQPVTQARHETVPQREAEIAHTFVERRLRKLPRVIDGHSQNEDCRDGFP